MKEPTLRESMTGGFSVSLAGWLATFLPATLIVAVQEISTPFSSFGLVLVSAILQHLGDGALAALALSIQRLAPRLDRLALRFTLWTAIGVGRGLIGGAFAAAMTGHDPQYLYRIVFWVLVTWAWMPGLAYAIHHLQLRRGLLGIRDAERARAAASSLNRAVRRDELRAELVAAVSASVGPAVDEIRDRLRRLHGRLDARRTRDIGDRIAAVAAETEHIVRELEPERAPAEATTSEVTTAPLAPLAAAIEFDQRRPLWGAVAMAATLGALLVPDTVRVGGLEAAAVVAAGILASVAAVLVAAGAERLRPPRTRRGMLASLAVRIAAAGVAGPVTMLLLDPSFSRPTLIAAIALPVTAAVAACIVPTIVGVRAANAALRDEIESLRAESERRRADTAADTERVREQVAELLHGPIQGRLSACAMALSFHAAAEQSDPERTSYIVTSVLDHLEAVAADLDALATPTHAA